MAADSAGADRVTGRPVDRRRPATLRARHVQHPHGRRRVGAPPRPSWPSARRSAPTCSCSRSRGRPTTGVRARPPRRPDAGARWWPRRPWPMAASTSLPTPRPTLVGPAFVQSDAQGPAARRRAVEGPPAGGPDVRTRSVGHRPGVPPAVRDVEVLPLGQLRRDPARRAVVRGVIDLAGGRSVGTHMSHITHGSHAQYRLLGTKLPRSPRRRCWPGT